MKFSNLHLPTLKEAPKDAEIPSHELLVRGGYIRKEAAGVYSYLPLAVRVIRKIEAIIAQEMDAAGAQQVLLPTVQPAERWQESGRWEQYGPELLRFVDRKNTEFCYAPTAEELIVSLVRRDVQSYRQLPVNLYQIQTKFRDELRPRAGLMRGREFIMKDAYSFDVDDEAAGKTYDAMYAAYQRIFERCGLEYRPVEADTGAIGGSRSHEFQVLADTGEDRIVSCGSCGYTANVEKAELKRFNANPGLDAQGEEALTLVDTPDQKTIEDVAGFLKVKKKKVLKAVLFDSDKGVVMALIRGDHELNEFKLKTVLDVDRLELKTDGDFGPAAARLYPGYLGPVGLPEGMQVTLIADDSVRGMADFVCGGNAPDKHYTGVNWSRDIDLQETHDLRVAKNADPCGRCGAKFRFFRGIEVGHVFFLGTKYSEPMGCTYLDQDGQDHPMVMGCYGIGVTRIMAAAIEQNHDHHGIQWPVPLAPYEVSILALGTDNEELMEHAQGIYGSLRESGVEVVLDDRDVRPGGKFNDSDLIGFPYQIVLGQRGLKEGIAEVKCRKTGERTSVPLDAVAAQIAEQVQAERHGAPTQENV